MTPRRIRVVLADDHTLVRHGIRKILEGRPGVEVVAEAADGDAALALVAAHQDLDVLVLDLKMPGRDALDVLREVKGGASRLKVIVLTMHAGQEYIARAVKAGADAYLLKDSAVQDLMAAVDAVVDGRSYFTPAIQHHLAGLVRGEAGPRRQLLTDREREVLGWLARGHSSREVAGELHISVRTVETHRAHLMEKLGVKSVAMLIQAAIREGLIEPPGAA
jgi:DNA-binding NarL/FixJ family response regulator